MTRRKVKPDPPTEPQTLTGVWAREGRAMCDELARVATERPKSTRKPKASKSRES